MVPEAKASDPERIAAIKPKTFKAMLMIPTISPTPNAIHSVTVKANTPPKSGSTSGAVRTSALELKSITR